MTMYLVRHLVLWAMMLGIAAFLTAPWPVLKMILAVLAGILLAAAIGGMLPESPVY